MHMIAYMFLIAILTGGQRGSGGLGLSFLVSAIGWNPDMPVPPTPTPIKSGWWRRGRSHDGDDASSSPGFRAPSSPESDDMRGDAGPGGGALQTPFRSMGYPAREDRYEGQRDSSENEHMQGDSPLRRRSVQNGAHKEAQEQGLGQGNHTSSGARNVHTARHLHFTPSSIPIGEHGSDYASRSALGGRGVAGAGGTVASGWVREIGNTGQVSREYAHNSQVGSTHSLSGQRSAGGSRVAAGQESPRAGDSRLDLPTVMSWERSKNSNGSRRRADSPPLPPRSYPTEHFRARSRSRERSLSRERTRISSSGVAGVAGVAGVTGVAGIIGSLRDSRGPCAGALERLGIGERRESGIGERRDSSPPRSVLKGGRVNTFALSPMSPLAGLPPGSTSAGVAKMTRRLTSSRSFLRDFFNVEAVDGGEHGTVYKCVGKMDLWPYAIKVIERGCVSARDRERVLQEIYALAAQGDNAHAVRYYSAWEEEDIIYIQMELCTGTVADEWKRDRGGVARTHTLGTSAGVDSCESTGAPLPEARLRVVAAHAAAGLAHMHRHGMVHLDVKPSNLFLSMSGLVKLGDFGNARSAEALVLEDDDEEGAAAGGGVLGEEMQLGDRRYVAPEVLNWEMQEEGKGGWYPADVFSLGACLYELASHRRLAAQGDEYVRLRRGEVPRLPSISQEFFQLISSMLLPEPRNRPTAEQLVQHGLLVPYMSVGLGGVQAGSSHLERMVIVLKEKLAAANSKISKFENSSKN